MCGIDIVEMCKEPMELTSGFIVHVISKRTKIEKKKVMKVEVERWWGGKGERETPIP